jgi:hypothetical protein
MQFIAGSQKNEVLPHHSINHDPRVHGLEMDNPPPQDKAVVCPLNEGGCTIHSNRTFHYTSPNRSTIPRRAYILLFGVTPTKLDHPRRFPWLEAKQTLRQDRAKASQETVGAKA